MTTGAHLRVAVLVMGGGLYLAAQLCRHGLHAITNAENRHSQFEHRLRRTRRLAASGDRFRSAGKDNAIGREFADRLIAGIPRMDFAVNAGLSHTACNKLGILRTEVEYQNALAVNVLGGFGIQRSLSDCKSQRTGVEFLEPVESQADPRLQHINRPGNWAPPW